MKDKRFVRLLNAAVTAFIIAVAVIQISGFAPFGFYLLETHYLLLLTGLPLGFVFLYLPRDRKESARTHVVDASLAVLTWAGTAVLYLEAENSLAQGYEFAAPLPLAILSLGFWFLVWEAARRAAGLSVAVVVLLASIYPIVNDWLIPEGGMSFGVLDAVSYYVFSLEAIFGLPVRTFAYLIVGYLMFGVALQHTGAAAFFMDISFGLFGRYRGGAAKVSVASSALLGSMNGSVVTNILTTGAMTIPAMKRSGLPSAFAGAVEACTSTGAVLMPPVMGATAFVMASFLGVPYSDVIIAAVLPSLLFYIALLAQVDAFAARKGIRGLATEELPRTWEVFRHGWHYLFVLLILVLLILFTENEGMAPFYATAFLLFWDQAIKRKVWRLDDWLRFFTDTGALFAEIVGALAGIGIVIGAMAMTGLAATITSQLAFVAGDSLIVLLVMAAVASFVLGFGLPSTPAYIFLAIVVAPALLRQGVEPMAAHLFLFYWGMISFITPPVAIGAFAAATLAHASPTRIGLQAVRLGTIIYFVPFFFVLNPVMILQGSAYGILIAVVTACAGIWLLVGGLQGHLIGVGPVSTARHGATWSLALRLGLFAAGIAFIAPGGGAFGVSPVALTAIAIALALPVVLLIRFTARERAVVRT